MKVNNDKKGIVGSILLIVTLIILILLFEFGVINFKSDKYANYVPNNYLENNIENDINNSDESNENLDKNGESENIVLEDEDVNEDEDKIVLFNENMNDSNVKWNIVNDTLTKESNDKISFKINDDGKIAINQNKLIDNIENAKSIRMFSPPSPYVILYVLTSDGDVYKYDTYEYETGNYNATKITSNIKQIVLYEKRSNSQKGGCDYIIGIDNNNNKYILNSFCV